MPKIENWSAPGFKCRIRGQVYGKEGFEDGTTITTSHHRGF